MLITGTITENPIQAASARKNEIPEVRDPVLQQDRILLKIETSGMSGAVLKSYFSFFQRGTGVILADDPWRVFIELGKNI